MMVFLGLVLAGCTESNTANPEISVIEPVLDNMSAEVSPSSTVLLPENSVESNQNQIEKKYIPLWPAGTLLSDDERKGWGLITKVKPETSEYYFRNVINPEEGQPYIIKDSSFEEMGTTYSAKGIDNKYINYEGKVIKMAIVSKTGSSILGYLEYDTNETMKHSVGE
ncbi:MAG: hypothetical protein JW931_03720 [Methanomicrobiaceae archaeon]|nr:hypothetical protein [Methanomicrobiaceae archaeon]